MLPIILEALAALEEGLVVAGRASLLADAVLGAEAIQAARFVPSTLRASRSLSRAWKLTHRVADQLNDITDSSAYSDFRVMIHELDVMAREFDTKQREINTGTLFEQSYERRDAREASFEEGFIMPAEFYGSTAFKSNQLLVPQRRLSTYATTPYVLERLAATYAGKKLLDRWTSFAADKSEALKLMEGYLARTLAKKLVITPGRKDVESKFQEIAQSWLADVTDAEQLDQMSLSGFKRTDQVPIMLYATRYTPLNFKEGVSLRATRLVPEDYSRFNQMVLQSGITTLRTLHSWLNAHATVPLADLKQMNAYNNSVRI